jgi:adhesin transport system outer membrane protein
MEIKKITLPISLRCCAPWLGVAGLSLILSGPVSSAGLAEVVRQALSSNPDVAEARNQWRARREEIRQAEGGFLPSVDLNAGIGYERTDSPSTRAAGEGANELTRRELGLTVRQMLFDGWGTRSEVQRQEARTDSAAARLLAVGESTAMRATQTYVDLQRYRELHGIAKESLAIHHRIEDQIRLRSEAGVGRRADYDQVRSRVALAEVNVLAAEANLLDAHTSFQRVVGVLPEGEYATVSAPADRLPDSIQRALELAQENNPVLQTAAADIRAAYAQHEAARQFDYPRLDLELGGNRNDNIGGTEGEVDDLSAMLRMRYNLYRGGSDAARKRATAHNINEAGDVRDRSVRQLEESIRLAWSAYKATAAQLPLLEQQVEAARATRDAYEKQFNIGQRTLLDLLNSENEVLQARQSVVETGADHLLAQFRLLEAMGSLVDHLGVAGALAYDE